MLQAPTALVQFTDCAFLQTVQVVPPVKNADLKLTVSTNREAVQVMEVFADMVMQVYCVPPVGRASGVL